MLKTSGRAANDASSNVARQNRLPKVLDIQPPDGRPSRARDREISAAYSPRLLSPGWSVSWSESQNSGDTIPNLLGEFREIRESIERIGIAAYGHPAGRLGATGVERLRPRENGLRSNGGERGKTDGFFRRIARFGAILKERDRSSRSGPVRSLPNRLSVSGSSQRGRVCARPDPAGTGGWSAWRVGRGAGGVGIVACGQCPVKPKAGSWR